MTKACALQNRGGMLHASVFPFLLVVASVVAGCAVDPTETVGESEAKLLTGCTSSDAWWKTQYDDPSPGSCEGKEDYSNCGPASIAMMRYALTCGRSDKTAAQMRSYINQTEKNAADTCGGTNPSDWNKTLDHANADGTWFADDAYSTMSTTNHCVASGPTADYTATDLAKDMASGAVTVAILAGDGTHGQDAPCGYAGGHALFVSAWNGSTFTVYDPDSHKNSKGQFVRCGESRKGSYKAQWTPAKVAAFADGFSGAKAGKLCTLTAKRTCIPGDTTTSGCSKGRERRCSDDFTWGACRCPNETTSLGCLSKTVATAGSN